ncbi:MAG: ROK family protein [Rhodobiaceae bacterium]|nr:ROK family protein [Rhodobiaceae bacterium]MCC0048785.1 ROK family protein [Rhodobiaceae bacterium]
MTERLLTGVDLGGTKISAVVMEPSGRELARLRVATPRDDYEATLTVIRDLVIETERAAGLGQGAEPHPFGIGTPGSTIPASGLIQNANSLWLNGKPLHRDLERVTGRRVVMANDANCLALSESADGAAAGGAIVFAVILGTGVGGGLVIDGKLLNGPLGISGEWGHNPLPWPGEDETPGPRCWCGRHGCIEAWLSGPALCADHERRTGTVMKAGEIAGADSPACEATMQRYRDRLARGLASVMNIIDPDTIVLGGGLSRIAGLAEDLPELILPHIFSDAPSARIVRAIHGDDSGVRGAARLCA